MGQLNMQVTPEFEQDLKALMEARGIATKSEAIRVAVKEALREPVKETRTNWMEWIGLANKLPDQPNPRILTDDEIWGDGPLNDR